MGLGVQGRVGAGVGVILGEQVGSGVVVGVVVGHDQSGCLVSSDGFPDQLLMPRAKDRNIIDIKTHRIRTTK